MLPCPDFCLFLLLSGWPRFGSVTVRAWDSSSGSGFRFRRFLPARFFFLFQCCFKRKGRFRFWFLKSRFRRFRLLFLFQQLSRVTCIGSLPRRARRTLGETPAKAFLNPSERQISSESLAEGHGVPLRPSKLLLENVSDGSSFRFWFGSWPSCSFFSCDLSSSHVRLSQVC